jgi:seryl-tRNA synthetase
MKLNRKTLRKIILREIKNITESQKLVGLPHQYTDMELYHHALKFLQQNPDLRNASPEIQEKGEMLLKILHNAVQQAVRHQEDYVDYSESHYGSYVPGTSAEETADMRDVQSQLKMVRNALAQSLPGHRHDYTGGSFNREAISDKMRQLAQSGQLKRGMQPSDVPELRRNMPAYQPGGRFYDPDDPIHSDDF